MLTVSNEVKNFDEIIIERGKHCAHLESGNPFLPGQEFIYSDKESEHFYKRSDYQTDELSPADITSDFFNKNLEMSQIRLRRHPNNPNLLNSLAQDYQRVGEFEKAITTYRKSLEIDPNLFSTIANLAKCYSLIGNVDKALLLYLELESKNVDSEIIFENIALLYLTKNNLGSALDYLNKAKAINQNNPSIWNNIGLVLLAKNEINKSISSLRKAFNLKSDDPNIANNVGVSFAVQGNLKKAINYFSIANKLKASDRNTLVNLSMAYNLTDQPEKVFELTYDYIKENDHEVELRNILAWSFFKMKNFNKSLGLLTKAIKHIDKSNTTATANLLNNIGIVYDNLGYKDKAEKLLITSIEVSSDKNIAAYCNLIHLYFSQKEDSKAKEIIDDALSTHPNNNIFNAYLGEYNFRKGEYELAKEIFYSVIEASPEILIPYASLTTLLTDIDENHEEAIRVIEKIFPYAQDNIQLINNYAYILIKQGNYKKARSLLDKVAEKNEVHLVATRGLLFIMEGNIKEGRRYYNKASKLAGKDQNLANLVEQKKQLELGNFYLRENITDKAIKCFSKGLSVTTKERYYKDQLKKLLSTIS